MPNPLAPLSDAEAKQEHDDIQAELAKEKGIKIPPDDKKPDDAPEPEDKGDKEPPAKEDKGKPDEPEKPDDSEEGDEDEPEVPPKRSDRRIPLSKFQDLKRNLKEVTEAKDTEIAQLKKDLEDARTSKDVKNVVKEFAAKHEVSEEFAKDMLDMAKTIMPKADPSKDTVITKAELFIKKQEAKDAFEAEFGSLTKDVPEAADLKEKIYAEAFKEGNLDKSLFEIYHRYVKSSESEVIPKKKTAEVTRGPSSSRNGPLPFDPKTVAEAVKNNTPGALAKLSDKQVDEVFAYMEKHGSNYI